MESSLCVVLETVRFCCITLHSPVTQLSTQVVGELQICSVYFCKIPSPAYYFHFLNEWRKGIDSVFEFLHAILTAQLKLTVGEFWYLEALLVPEIDVIFIGLRIVINQEERNNSSHICCDLHIYIKLCLHIFVFSAPVTDFQSTYAFVESFRQECTEIKCCLYNFRLTII